MRGFPPLCRSSRQSDSSWRNLSTQGADVRDVLGVLGVWWVGLIGEEGKVLLEEGK